MANSRKDGNALFNFTTTRMTHFRWVVCTLLFFATTVNYLDRQVLSLTWSEFIAPEFHWNDNHYGTITALFSIFYAVSMLFAGRFVDWIGVKKGFLWAIGVWSVGAMMHAGCGIITAWWVGAPGKQALITETNIAVVGRIIMVSVTLFIFSRFVLAVGESANFPAVIKATAEFFPKKDRAFAQSIANAGTIAGAMIAPLSIPVIAYHWGWETAFILMGVLGFVWMGFWVFLYHKPDNHPKVNQAELAYIRQDPGEQRSANLATRSTKDPHLKQRSAGFASLPEKGKISFGEVFRYRQTWAFAVGQFMTVGVWWFLLFWAPRYLETNFGIKTSDPQAMLALFVLYSITLLSIFGGYLPTVFIKKGTDPYLSRMRAMLIFAFFPLLLLFVQPLGVYFNSFWLPVIIIGIVMAAHQSWIANLFTTVSDMFPQNIIATVSGIGGLAGGIASFAINKASGMLFEYAEATQLTFMGFEGKPAGYYIIFSICAFVYLAGWVIMRLLNASQMQNVPSC